MLERLFSPRSVAIIGASTKEYSIGNRIIKNLIDYNYKGPIYPVNPKADTVRDLKSYDNITDVPGDVDVVHIVIPAEYVSMAIDDCAKKKVPFVIVNTAGFKESGDAGIQLEKEMVEKAHRYGMRIFGPNCQGIINTDSSINAYCNFTFTKPTEGSISIFAQSGGVGEVINQRFSELDVGVRMYASNGNACDISINDIISYWIEDEKTKVIVLYIENLTQPKELYDIIKKATLKKPVLAMKGGRTKEGAKAASSHTGGLAHKEIATELLLEKAGVLIFQDQEELCQAAIAFSMQPVPKGNRVGLITNTGGPAIIATDQLVESGFTIPILSDETQARLREHLFEAASVKNPVDVLATAGAEHFKVAIETLLADHDLDSLYINFVTPFFVDNESVAHEIVFQNSKKTKPIICNLMTDKSEWAETVEILKAGDVPCYNFAEMGARALSALHRYSQILAKEPDETAQLSDINRSDAQDIMSKARDNGASMLSATEAYSLLSAYGIPLAQWDVVDTLEQAVEAAEKIGFPVVIKADAEEIIHKSDVGGVALNLKDASAVEKAVTTMQEKLAPQQGTLRFFVQKFHAEGLELIIGAKKEGHMGHVLIFGLGGIYVEVLKDVAFGLAPLSTQESLKMIESIKAAPLLSGYRGQPSVDKKRISELILRCSQLVIDFPEIVEMDLNPIKAKENSISVVDARIRIENE